MTAPETRRFPITLRRLSVLAVEDLTPHMRRVTLGGAQIGAFEAAGERLPAMASLGPDDHVKLFFPDPATGRLSLPVQGPGRLRWPDAPPAISREYTPRAFDPGAGALVLDMVLHGHGIAAAWAAQAGPGQVVHVAGPKASMLVPQAPRYLLMGDETALPAIANWLEMLPGDALVTAHVLIRHPDARLPLRHGPGATVCWHPHDDADPHAFVRLAGTADPDCFVWAAGERGAISALRAHLAAARRPDHRSDLSSYWTRGEAAEN